MNLINLGEIGRMHLIRGEYYVGRSRFKDDAVRRVAFIVIKDVIDSCHGIGSRLRVAGCACVMASRVTPSRREERVVYHASIVA